jgi:HEAT repeat protein
MAVLSIKTAANGSRLRKLAGMGNPIPASLSHPWGVKVMLRSLVLCLLFIASPVWSNTQVADKKQDIATNIRLLRDEGINNRIRAAEALAQYREEAKDAVPALVECLKDKNPLLRQKAIIALSLIRGHAKIAVPALIKSLDDKGKLPKEAGISIPEAAVMALSSYGPDAKEAASVLFKLAKASNGNLKNLAIYALGRTKADRERVVPFLLETLAGKDEGYLRGQAARALTGFGPDPSFIGPLLRAYECEDVKEAQRKATLRSHILVALGQMGKYAVPVIPKLLGIIKDRKVDERVRVSGLRAIEELGPLAKQAIPDLIECLGRKDSTVVHSGVISVLPKFGEEAIGPLRKNLTTTDFGARYRTIDAISKFGPKAAAAIPDLRRIADDDDEDRQIRSKARAALRAIRGN